MNRTIRLFAILTLLTCVAGVPVDAAAPESTMEERAGAFLVAFNSGNADTYKRFLSDHKGESPPPDDYRQRYETLFERLGALQLLGVFVEDDHQLRMRVTSSDDRVLELIFSFHDEAPYYVDTIGIESTSRGSASENPIPPVAIEPTMPAAKMQTAISSWIDDVAESGAWSGALLVAHNGKPLYSGAHGLASRSFHVPNSTQTRFRVGSITKDFVDIAIARLVVDGQLSPSLTLATMLPDYPNAEVAQRITLDQLVTHRSGLGDMNYTEYLSSHRPRLRRPADYIALFADKPLLFDPGSGREYSNAGYIVLGAIIEHVTGMHWEDYVAESVFKPAGMKGAGHFDMDRPHENVAIGYMQCPDNREQWCNNYYWIEAIATPSGGSYATAEDLLKFDVALRANRLLPPAFTSWFFTREWPLDGQKNFPAYPEVGLAGGAEGVSAVVWSNSKWTIVALANQDAPGAEPVAMRVRDALLRGGGTTSESSTGGRQ